MNDANDLTLETLLGVAKAIPTPTDWRFVTVSAQSFRALWAKIEPAPGANGVGEVFEFKLPMLPAYSIEPKAGQVMPAWFFNDEKLFRAYLLGYTTETELIEMWTNASAAKRASLLPPAELAKLQEKKT